MTQIVKSDLLAPGPLQNDMEPTEHGTRCQRHIQILRRGEQHRDFAAFRYSRNTSTTAGGNTNLRIEAFVFGTLNCIFPFTS